MNRDKLNLLNLGHLVYGTEENLFNPQPLPTPQVNYFTPAMQPCVDEYGNVKEQIPSIWKLSGDGELERTRMYPLTPDESNPE
jgi:hypothetical protein